MERLDRETFLTQIPGCGHPSPSFPTLEQEALLRAAPIAALLMAGCLDEPEKAGESAGKRTLPTSASTATTLHPLGAKRESKAVLDAKRIDMMEGRTAATAALPASLDYTSKFPPPGDQGRPRILRGMGGGLRREILPGDAGRRLEHHVHPSQTATSYRFEIEQHPDSVRRIARMAGHRAAFFDRNTAAMGIVREVAIVRNLDTDTARRISAGIG